MSYYHRALLQWAFISAGAVALVAVFGVILSQVFAL